MASCSKRSSRTRRTTPTGWWTTPRAESRDEDGDSLQFQPKDTERLRCRDVQIASQGREILQKGYEKRGIATSYDKTDSSYEAHWNLAETLERRDSPCSVSSGLFRQNAKRRRHGVEPPNAGLRAGSASVVNSAAPPPPGARYRTEQSPTNWCNHLPRERETDVDARLEFSSKHPPPPSAKPTEPGSYSQARHAHQLPPSAR